MNRRGAKGNLLTVNGAIVNCGYQFAISGALAASVSAMYFRVAAGSSFQILIEITRPIMANGMTNSGHHCQLCVVILPRQNDCSPLPRYANPSTIPEQVAVALRPPKSVAAVPDISEVMPIEAITMNTADQPTVTG
jgi:hypothetical protein